MNRSLRAATRRLAEAGYLGLPTSVNNVETYAHVALVLCHGADWYADLGTSGSPGPTIVTITGDVRHLGAGLRRRAGGVDADDLLRAVSRSKPIASWIAACTLRLVTASPTAHTEWTN